MGEIGLSESLSTKANAGIQRGRSHGEDSGKPYFGFSEVWRMARAFREMGVGDTNRFAETSGQTERWDAGGAFQGVGRSRIIGCGGLRAYRFAQSYIG